MSQQDYIDDGSYHKACRICGLCIECGDCESYGCLVDIRISEIQNQLFDWLLDYEGDYNN
jgi:hypothetical protein